MDEGDRDRERLHLSQQPPYNSHPRHHGRSRHLRCEGNAGTWQCDLDGSVCQLTNEARSEMSLLNLCLACKEEEDEVKRKPRQENPGILG